MIGLLITARMGSSRLPRKHLIEANGKPMLYWLIKRFELAFETEIKDQKVQLVIASSEKPENSLFEQVIKDTTCKLFQGSDNNIPLRHLQCAKKFNFSHVISIDGDDIFCSAGSAKLIAQQMALDTNCNYFSTEGLPLGMNVSGYSVHYLEESLSKYADEKMETGWGRVFKDPIVWKKNVADYDVMGDLRFTLDYQEDADFFCEVINRLKEKIITISDADLIDYVNKHKLHELNSGLKKVYWDNYNAEKKKELEGQ